MQEEKDNQPQKENVEKTDETAALLVELHEKQRSCAVGLLNAQTELRQAQGRVRDLLLELGRVEGILSAVQAGG